MTLGLVLEALTGKAAALSGAPGIDAQETYSPLSTKDTEKVLLANGFSRNGTEIYISGTTGKPIKARVFSGLVSYFKLGHIASSKRYSRSTGQCHRLTRLPVEGRQNNGGLRTGIDNIKTILLILLY